MKEYVRRVEFRFIKNMMKGRGKCSWEVIGQLCDAYCAKYGGIKAWEMRYQERRYHKRWTAVFKTLSRDYFAFLLLRG